VQTSPSRFLSLFNAHKLSGQDTWKYFANATKIAARSGWAGFIG